MLYLAIHIKAKNAIKLQPKQSKGLLLSNEFFNQFFITYPLKMKLLTVIALINVATGKYNNRIAPVPMYSTKLDMVPNVKSTITEVAKRILFNCTFFYTIFISIFPIISADKNHKTLIP